MSGKRRLTKSFKGLDVVKLDKPRQIRGLLGLNNNGTNQVEVPNRAGYVWVRLRDHLSEVIQAYNSNVSPVYDLPVFVTRDSDDPTRYIVVGRDTAQYQNWGAGAAYLPRHANQHSFSDDAGAAGDVVWVFGRQFMPFLGYPSGSFGAGNIIISPYTFYSQNQQWIYAGNTGTADIVAYKPTGSNARVVLVYVDEYGNPQVSPGSYFAATITGTSQIINYLPTLPSGTFPISAVRLVSGTSVINWSNLYDLRPFYSESISVLGGTDGGGGGGGIPERSLPIYDDHIFKITGTLIDFTDNISVVVTGSVAFVSSVASGGGGIPERSLPIQDDSIFKVTGTAISFDKDLIVTVSGTIAHVEVPANTFASGSHTHPAGATAIQIYDDGVYKATGTLVSFDSGLNVLASGTSAYISVPSVDIGSDLADIDAINFNELLVNPAAPGSGHRLIFAKSDGFYQENSSGTVSILGGSTGSSSSIPTYPAIYERGSFIATGTSITFDGNVDVSASGAFVSVLFPTTTYQRVAQPNPLGTITGSIWQTPERVYASGSLAVFLNGLIQVIDTDYREQFFVSGTYQYLKEVPTGTVHMIMYGIPCIIQTQPGTGTTSPFAIMDSNSVLLLDSNSTQLLDSNG